MFQWAFIGAGAIARKVAGEIAENGHSVAAVYSRTPARAEEFAQKCGARVCGSLEELLRSGADAAYIATPHASHYPYLMACIGAGMPVLCEKAFTVNAAQAERALGFARQRGVFVMEGMWTRFLPVIRAVQNCIAAGEIGQIQSVQVEFSTGFSSSREGRPQRLFRAEDAGGALLDLGCYCVSFCRMLLGAPRSVDCRMKTEGGIDTEEAITLGYDNARCEIVSSFDRPHRVFAEIVGSKGKIELPEFNAPVEARVYAGERVRELSGERGYRFEFDAFREDVRAGKTENALMPVADTISVMETLDECRRQNKFTYPAEIERV